VLGWGWEMGMGWQERHVRAEVKVGEGAMGEWDTCQMEERQKKEFHASAVVPIQAVVRLWFQRRSYIRQIRNRESAAVSIQAHQRRRQVLKQLEAEEQARREAKRREGKERSARALKEAQDRKRRDAEKRVKREAQHEAQHEAQAQAKKEAAEQARRAVQEEMARAAEEDRLKDSRSASSSKGSSSSSGGRGGSNGANEQQLSWQVLSSAGLNEVSAFWITDCSNKQTHNHTNNTQIIKTQIQNAIAWQVLSSVEELQQVTTATLRNGSKCSKKGPNCQITPTNKKKSNGPATAAPSQAAASPVSHKSSLSVSRLLPQHTISPNISSGNAIVTGAVVAGAVPPAVTSTLVDTPPPQQPFHPHHPNTPDYTAIVTRVYQRYNPEKLTENFVKTTLLRYAGREETLLAALKKKYEIEEDLVAEVAAEGGDYAALLTQIYQEHDPEKLANNPTFVPQMLSRYEGREVHLLAALRQKYGVVDGNSSGAGASCPATQEASSVPHDAPDVTVRVDLEAEAARIRKKALELAAGAEAEVMARLDQTRRIVETRIRRDESEGRLRRLRALVRWASDSAAAAAAQASICAESASTDIAAVAAATAATNAIAAAEGVRIMVVGAQASAAASVAGGVAKGVRFFVRSELLPMIRQAEATMYAAMQELMYAKAKLNKKATQEELEEEEKLQQEKFKTALSKARLAQEKRTAVLMARCAHHFDNMDQAGKGFITKQDHAEFFEAELGRRWATVDYLNKGAVTREEYVQKQMQQWRRRRQRMQQQQLDNQRRGLKPAN
jgi:hypothetical protein